jgi:hypothetical protein
MNNITLSNILMSAVPNEGFGIYGSVDSESDYNSNVVYNDPSKKPTWSVVQSGEIPEQWKIVRGERDAKLQSCDWTVLPDVPMSDAKREEWETYRQALRDITDQSDPFNITWPTPPA